VVCRARRPAEGRCQAERRHVEIRHCLAPSSRVISEAQNPVEDAETLTASLADGTDTASVKPGLHAGLDGPFD